MPYGADTLAAAIAPRAIPFDENGIVDWIVDAEAHDFIAYYRGHLTYDRNDSARVLSPPDRRQLVAVARRIMVAAEQGLVCPVQKRIGPQDFVYLAIRASARRLVLPMLHRPVLALAA
jgi:hypothetical protein